MPEQSIPVQNQTRYPQKDSINRETELTSEEKQTLIEQQYAAELNRMRYSSTSGLQKNLNQYYALKKGINPPSKRIYSMMYLGSGLGDIVDIADVFGVTIVISAAVDIIVGIGLWISGNRIKKEIEELSKIIEQLDTSLNLTQQYLRQNIQQILSYEKEAYKSSIKPDSKKISDVLLQKSKIRAGQIRATKLGNDIRTTKLQAIEKLKTGPLKRLIGTTLIDIFGWILSIAPWRSWAVYKTRKQHEQLYQIALTHLETTIKFHESALHSMI